MKSNTEDPISPSSLSESSFPWNLVLAVVFAPLSCFLIVFCFTSIADFIHNIDINLLDEFPFIVPYIKSQTPIIWPPALYFGGIIGGIIGGLLAYWEIRTELSKNSSLKPVPLFSSDIFYLGLLTLLIYVLEILSESIILQGLLFILEIAFFTVIGRYISRLTVSVSETSTESDITDTEP
ncbi:MAG: hypothetical protein JSU57_00330 [Candidatus Heimdallarchaeota archaeon]|nr:MAG: hypothetical protein JSU57_00330 [Candidatus Heimdallarchaeota archaeon]